MLTGFTKRPFRIRIEVSKATFADYESFVRSFAGNAGMAVRGFDESQSSYQFENGWNAALNRQSNVDLCSPVLDAQSAREVNRVIEVLETMNVKLGENCEAHIHHENSLASRWVRRLVGKVSLEIWCGLWLVFFLVVKTVEIQLYNVLAVSAVFFLQCVGYSAAGIFAVCLYKAAFRDKGIASSIQSNNTTVKETDGIGLMVTPRDKSNPAPVLHPGDVNLSKFAAEIKHPLDNMMAYARFYQTALETDSQHGKDLAELMEQAIRIQEVLSRLTPSSSESRPDRESEDPGLRSRFRRTPRILELIPVMVRGTDPLGEEFETPSYTLNTSCRGACLLLPNKIIKPGQQIALQNHRFATEAEVRWVVQGKAGSMVFAGVQFAKPLPTEEPPTSV